MKTVILNWEYAEESTDVYEFLHEVLETDDILTLFEGEPDMIQMGGEKILFTDFTHNGNQYVIYCDGSYTSSEDKITEMLSSFYDNERFIDSFESVESEGLGWAAFQDNMVAYRGGSGYYYSIWEYVA